MSWLDKTWKYVRSDKQGEGYLKRRFAQIRAEQKAAAEQAAKDEAERAEKVRAMKGRK